uniref:aspartate transaminase n=1 Tax=Lepisosteus oculatus TaxID=7918 RepID=W5NCQ7_LEPOC|nr:PREDICTED: aspartate aminotransferase, cytoplasmic-like isoform X1 [Lepisosteus oculatus]
MSTLSVFIETPTVPLSPKTTLLAAYTTDKNFNKVYLGAKEYLTEDGRCYMFPFIWKIKLRMADDPTLTSRYLPISGFPEFTRSATELALGQDSPAIIENRAGAIQTVGRSGAVRLGAELLRQWYNVNMAWCGPVYLSSPCEDSLANTFRAAGITDVRHYHYWDPEKQNLAVEKLLEDLEKAPELAVIVLSASAHCPTGTDPSQDQWKLIAQVMMKRRLFPFFLLPAQGLCSGDPAQDSWPLRHFVSLGQELFCAQSFSHNFGLYGERTGCLLFVLKESTTLLAVQSQAENMVRTLWSHPPGIGARVVTTVLNNPAHLAEWQEGLKRIVEQGMLVRERLREKLRVLGTPGCWDHLTQQAGMYCYTGLTGKQVDFLAKKKHVYLPADGCLNISALNSRNLDYVAESIHQAVTCNL